MIVEWKKEWKKNERYKANGCIFYLFHSDNVCRFCLQSTTKSWLPSSSSLYIFTHQNHQWSQKHMKTATTKCNRWCYTTLNSGEHDVIVNYNYVDVVELIYLTCSICLYWLSSTLCIPAKKKIMISFIFTQFCLVGNKLNWILFFIFYFSNKEFSSSFWI